MPSSHLILCRPLLLPSIFPSIKVFSNKLGLGIRRPKDWNFSISPSSEYSGFISFRIDSFSLISLLSRGLARSSPASQFKSINSLTLSLLSGPAFISIRDYWKNHSFDYMDLCLQCDVWFLIRCLGLLQLFFRGASILISPSTVILVAQENKICHCFHFSTHLFAMQWWDWMPWS